MDATAKQFPGLDHNNLPSAIGAVEALRADYDRGFLSSISEMIHGELFADFLEMADHLLSEGYKDAAAVIAGSALESHLRALADKSGLPISNDAGDPLKAARLNDDLRNADVYGKGDQKAVTAWLDLRNNAAHGHYEKYQSGQVGLMIAGIRDLIRRLPA